MIIVKEHKTPKDELMLALCDEEVQGKVFTEGKLQLDCSADFYAGEAHNEETIRTETVRMLGIEDATGVLLQPMKSGCSRRVPLSRPIPC
jgi:hypothetical protein